MEECLVLSTFRKFFAWFTSKVETMIAVCSLVVATSALYVSVTTARTDLEYKEVSIQPRLWLGGEHEHLGLELRNTGLGPALVKGVAFALDKKCISSTDKDRDDFTPELEEFLKSKVDELYITTLSPRPWRPGGRMGYNVEVNPIGPGDVIRPGESLRLIQLSADDMSDFNGLGRDEKFAAWSKFAEAAFALPIQIFACSLTERTCGVVGNPLPSQCKNLR
jgi:hypothetical protein